MAESDPVSTIKLAKELVEQSCGLAMDLGGSVTKIIYRSKEDYRGGKPKEVSDLASKYGVGNLELVTNNSYGFSIPSAKQYLTTILKWSLWDDSSGILRTVTFPREDLDSALSFVLDNCDLTENEEGVRCIPCAGLGGNLYKEDIETRLNAKLHNLPEFICFRKAVMSMVKTQPPEEAFIKHTAKELEMAREEIEVYNAFAAMDGMGGTIDPTAITDEDIMGIEDSGTDFPCLIVMCGSAFVIFKLDENGQQEFAGVSLFAGRFFLGNSAIMTGVTDYKKLTQMVNTSDGKTADLYTQDMTKSVKGDTYSSLSQQDMLIFPFGKCNTTPRDQIKDGDLVHSLAYVMCDNIGQMVHLTSTTHNIRRAYFCGGFISEEFNREQILRAIYFNNAKAPKGRRLQADFLNHGAFLGALGAFISLNEKKN